MCSTILSILLVFLFFITITEGGKHVDKIIIHVPYKILKHHHTHTKYKILTIHHNPKKEIITYYKVPVNQHPEAKFMLDMEMKDSELKGFVSPHHVSEPHLLLGQDSKASSDLKGENVMEKKPIELHTHENEISNKEFNPSFTFDPTISHHFQEEMTPMTLHKPMISIHPHHQVPQFSFKPFTLPTPSHELSLPKFPSTPMTHTSHDMFHPMMLPHKLSGNFPDSIPHTSSHIYNTIIPPSTKKPASYEVREANQEGTRAQASFARNPKFSLSKPQNFRHKLFEVNDEPEYEHVGYLIIDGDRRKVVGKDKHVLHTWS